MTQKFQSKNIFGFARLLIGLGLLVAFVLILNALFASRTAQTINQSHQPAAQSFSPTSTTVVNPTSPMNEWKTYKNTDFSFSIMYPPTWSLSEDKSDSTHQLPIVYFFDVARKSAPDSFEGVTIQVVANPSNIDPKRWIERNFSKGPIDPDKDFGYEAVSIAGEQGLKVTGLPSRFGSLVVYLPHNSKIYVLSLEPFDKTNPKFQTDLPVFDAMIHTLKFFD